MTAKKWLCGLLTAILLARPVSAVGTEELLARVLVRAFPEAGFAAQVSIAAAVRNRAEAHETSVPAVLDSLIDEGVIREADLGAIPDGRAAELARDAARAALGGADPTGGALYFKRLAPGKPDLRFDDARENQYTAQASRYSCVIDGLAFWGDAGTRDARPFEKGDTRLLEMKPS